MTEPLFEADDQLKERVKELNCLYNIAQLVEEPDISLEGILKGVVGLLPPAWRYPDITCARISFDDKEFKTDNFGTTSWKQSADIMVKGNKVGIVEVYYLEEKPRSYEGPFLKEEKDLIEAIAERLGRIVERKQAEKTISELATEWARTFDAINDFVFIIDKEYKFTRANKAFLTLLKKRPEELIGKKCHEVLHGSAKPWPDCPADATFKDGKPHTAKINDPKIGISLLVSTSPLLLKKVNFLEPCTSLKT